MLYLPGLILDIICGFMLHLSGLILDIICGFMLHLSGLILDIISGFMLYLPVLMLNIGLKFNVVPSWPDVRYWYEVLCCTYLA